MTDRTVRVRYEALVNDFVANVEKMKASQDQMAKSSTNTGKKHDEAWSKIGTVSAIAGGLVFAGVAKATSAFIDFDAKMSAASAATGATGEELGRLRELAIQMGADTQFSASEAADAITEMGKAGVSTANIMGGGLKGALDLAAAGQLDVGRAGEIAATAMNQFGLAGSDIPHVADLLAAAAGKAQGSVEDVANAMKYVGPVAKSMGISIEETTGVIGEFASKGILGEQAGTSLRGVLLSLSAPSDAAKDAMDQYGISLYDANGHVKNLASISETLHEKLSGVDEATRNAALGQIFGNAQITAATVLYEGGSKSVQDWTNKVNDAGFAQRQAAALTDNLKGDIERLGGSIDTAFIKSGSSANAVLRSMAQSAEAAVNVISDLPAPVLLGGAALTGFALLGPKVVEQYRDVKKVLDDAGLSIEKIGEKSPRAATGLSRVATVAKGAAAAFAGLAVASRTMDGAMDQVGVQQLTNDLGDGADALDTINKAFAGATGTGTGFDSNVKSLGDALRYTFDSGIGDQVDSTAGSIFAAFGGNNTSDIKVASDRITQLDQALVGLVSGGNASQAANVMGQIQQAAQNQGISLEQLQKIFPGYYEALATSSSAATQFTGAVDTSATSIDKAAQQTQAWSDALKQLTSPVLDARDAARAWEASIDAADQALKDNGKTLDITKDKGRANQAAIDGMARAAIAQIGAMEQNGASQEQLQATLTSSRASLEATAVKFGMTKSQAKAYADQVLSTPKTISTAATFNASQANATLAAFKSNLDRVNGTTVTTYANTVVLGSARKQAADVVSGKADGGLLTGPGTATSDSIPILASNGEYVIKAAAVDHYGAGFFDQLNAMRFADGGFVARSAATRPTTPVASARTAPLLVVEQLNTRDTAADAMAALNRQLGDVITAAGFTLEGVLT